MILLIFFRYFSNPAFRFYLDIVLPAIFMIFRTERLCSESDNNMIGLLEPKPVSRVLLILCKYANDKNRRYVLFCQCCHRKSSRPLSASNIEQYSDLSHKTPDEAIVQASFSDLKVTIYVRLDVICALPYGMSKKIAEWFIWYCGNDRLQFELCCKQKWRPWKISRHTFNFAGPQTAYAY